MSVLIQIFEQTPSGPVEIEQIDWSKSSFDLPYYLYPLRRPIQAKDQVWSYQRFVFFKVSGTYSAVKNFKVKMTIDEAKQATKTQFFYKWTNTFVTPTNAYDGGMTFFDLDKLPVTWYPPLGASPETAFTRETIYGPDATFYTPYLVTQIRVNEADWEDVGNTDTLQFKASLNEFE